MRCFIAVDIPEEIKEKVKELQDQLKPYDVKLVEPQNMHFTLKFLGEINDQQVNEIKQSMSKLKKTQPFSVLLSSVGAFPSLTYIKVIWIGAVSQGFVNLHKSVSTELRNIGKNDKETTTHLTIARVRSPKNKEILTKIIRRYENEPFGSLTIDKITIENGD